jgi:hypothetical protein
MAKSERRKKIEEAKAEKQKSKALRSKYGVESKYAKKGGKHRYAFETKTEN